MTEFVIGKDSFRFPYDFNYDFLRFSENNEQVSSEITKIPSKTCLLKKNFNTYQIH